MAYSKLGFVRKIESMGTLDGPGVRTVVFFSGCPLRCSYCHNPDLWKTNESDKIALEDLVERVLRFKPFHGSEGGITVSGGEPLSQPAFLISFLKRMQEEGIHTALDTSGFGNAKYFDEILKYTDLVIFDLKEPNPFDYPKLTGVVKRISEQFADAIRRNNKDVWLRTVIVPNKNDTLSKMDELASEINTFENVKKVQLLPYHTMGNDKYSELGIEYELEGVPAMSKEKTLELEEYLKSKLSFEI